MKAKTYFIVCLLIALGISLTILFVPGFADSLESWLLRTLSNTARVVI